MTNPTESEPIESEPVAPAVADPSPRERAAEAGRALLASPEWEPVAPRTLLMLVRPPNVDWVEASDAAGTSMLWVVLDSPEARALPLDLRTPLVAGGAALARLPAEGDTPPLEVAVFTSEGVARLLEGVTRRSLEARWLVRHAQPLHDPLHRFDLLVGAAARLPADALERVVRPLYVQAAQGLDALAMAPMEGRRDAALVLAGEAAGAVCRIACVVESGAHPPPQWLAAAARETRLGKRVASWLDDLAAAVGGDERAGRWVRDSGAGVLREVAGALHAEFAGRDWLQDPQAQAIRPAR